MGIAFSKIGLTLVFLAIILFICGCGEVSIKEINEKPESYLGKEVVVKEVAKDTVKIGTLSGFKLRDGEHTIAVSSKTLPEEGKGVKVKGTLMKDLFIGYYIYANKIY
ncbi:MAG: hypothetical protein K6T16_00970 [Candidatus Pacearchaeota archaeon]|nr:hypothetical protein [Candidatus Pacearchaeota archaeon]